MEKRVWRTILITLLLGAYNPGCAPIPVSIPENIKISPPRVISEVVECGLLSEDIKGQIQAANRNGTLENLIINLSKSQTDPIVFGDKTIARSEYEEFSKKLINAILKENGDEFVLKNATCVGVYTRKPEGVARNVLVTGYFTPIISASRTRSKHYSSPIYTRPDSLLTIDPSLFGYSGDKILRARVNNGRVLPYYSRAEIESSTKPLAKIIGWLDPIDLFHAQVQGSMIIQFEDGERQSLEYADKNGHNYIAIGAELPIDPPVSWQKIERYLRELPEGELIDVLNINPSYVFFKQSSIVARTASGDPAISEITVAADRTIFPFGLIGLLKIGAEDKNHLVIVHDTGGAIRGTGRIDWYKGVGELPGEVAGNLRSEGKFVILLPKTSH